MATDESPTTATEQEPKHEPVKRTGADSDEKKPRKRRLWLRVLIVVLVVIVVAVGALAALFAWDRWYRYDDAADFQGRWYPAGATTAVEIGADAIVFDSETSYAYTLDTREKSVMYTLGNLVGKGHYWFANDRNALVIKDCNSDFTTSDTTFEDLGRMLADLGATVSGNGRLSATS